MRDAQRATEPAATTTLPVIGVGFVCSRMTHEKDELHQLFNADANDCCARDGSVFAAVCYIEPKSNSAQYSSDGQIVFFAATKNGTVHAYLFDLPSVVLETIEAWRTTSAALDRIGATLSLEDIARVVIGL